jgi:DNA-directed RNA polymerase specialized sigma24 family protein
MLLILDKNSFSLVNGYCIVEAEHLELSKAKEKELFEFMKRTKNKEEYRRASTIKQKMEGLPYRTIARNPDVNYRNVYNWIQEYKRHGIIGISSKRKNAGSLQDLPT